MKGISSIIGALIFLQILLISLVLVIHFQNNEDYITISTIQKLHSLQEASPIMEFEQNSTIYLYSLYPIEITHIIYPDGKIVNKNVTITITPADEILNGYKWAIVVTNQGTWFNITNLKTTLLNPSIITFPLYKDYGEPEGGIVENISYPPNWNYLGGIYSPPGYAIVPLNATIGNTEFSYGLTGAEVVFMPQSQWINLTLLGQLVQYNGNYTSIKVGLYVPMNVTGNVYPIWSNPPKNIQYTFEYTYLYFRIFWYEEYTKNAVTNQWCYLARIEVNPPTYFTLYGFHTSPSYYISGFDFSWGYPPSNNYGTIYPCTSTWEPSVYGYNQSMRSEYLLFDVNQQYNFIIYQIDLNLQKGITLVWAYIPPTISIQPYIPNNIIRNGEWLLVYNYTWQGFGKTFCTGGIVQYPLSMKAIIDSIQINTQYSQYPSYVVVPEGTYLLEIST